MIAGEGAVKVGLASHEVATSHVEACKRQTLLEPEALS